MGKTILKNVAVLDTSTCAIEKHAAVTIAAGRIARIDWEDIPADGAEVIDCGGRTLMPGLIDCHLHINMSASSSSQNAILPNSLVAARAVAIMNAILMRGFTTVRDTGGADQGYVQAVEEGTIIGPDLVICGKMLCQSGGHQDVRFPWDDRNADFLRQRLGSKSRLCDGVAEVRRAAREEIRSGARFIKIIANGGVASDKVPLSHLAFSDEEISAAVEEAANADTYVAAHAYSNEAIARCVRLGVKSIEHCVLVSPQTAAMMAENDVTAVPTVATFEALTALGASFGVPPLQVEKANRVRDKVYESLSILKKANVRMAFGTDLTHVDTHRHQSDEFTYRARVLSSPDVLRSATIDAARLLQMEDEIGNVFVGGKANLLVVQGDPTDDVTILSDPRNIRLIMKDGVVVRNDLAGS